MSASSGCGLQVFIVKPRAAAVARQVLVGPALFRDAHCCCRGRKGKKERTRRAPCPAVQVPRIELSNSTTSSIWPPRWLDAVLKPPTKLSLPPRG